MNNMTVFEAIAKELKNLEKNMEYGDKSKIAKTVGIQLADVSRYFSGKIRRVEVAVKIRDAANDIINERTKLIA